MRTHTAQDLIFLAVAGGPKAPSKEGQFIFILDGSGVSKSGSSPTPPPSPPSTTSHKYSIRALLACLYVGTEY